MERSNAVLAWALGASVLMASVVHANLIADGDFEGAGAGPWTTGTAPWGSNQAFNFDAAGVSGQGLRLFFSGTNGAGSGSFAAWQGFTVPAGVNNIDVSLDWSAIQGSGNGWYEILLQPSGGNYDAPSAGNWPAGHFLRKEEYGFGGGIPPHGAFQTFNFNNLAVTPGNSYQIVLKMGGSPGNGNQSFFDNVNVTPEPAALAMLAVSSLLIQRRRRRA